MDNSMSKTDLQYFVEITSWTIIDMSRYKKLAYFYF